MSSYWRDSAACAGSDPEMFLAETGAEAWAAVALCAACPVREACLEAALAEEKNERATGRAGIRGGLTPKQRAAVAKKQRGTVPRKTRRRTGGKPISPCGTPGAYDRHLRWGEPVDDACRLAHNEKRRRDVAAKQARTVGPIVCGTRRGYHKHRRNGEKACDPCRYANAAADRRLRTTGSTVPATLPAPAAAVPAA